LLKRDSVYGGLNARDSDKPLEKALCCLLWQTPGATVCSILAPCCLREKNRNSQKGLVKIEDIRPNLTAFYFVDILLASGNPIEI
jgi:hypothetical protein